MKLAPALVRAQVQVWALEKVPASGLARDQVSVPVSAPAWVRAEVPALDRALGLVSDQDAVRAQVQASGLEQVRVQARV